MKTTDPKFEVGAIAYYCESELAMLPCTIVRPKIKSQNEPRMYRVRTNTGLFIDIPAFELWTGWEENFPGWLKIERGNIIDWNKEQIVEELADDEDWSDKLSDFEDKWKLKSDIDYYEKLMQEYEPLEPSNSNSED